MQILGELASVGSLPGVAWVLRCIIRDILDYRSKRAEFELKQQMIQRIPDDQVASVFRELGAEPGAAQE
ncbi:hypothetical protein ACFW08_26195 [Streptomyces sp. NPDC058960]|uniref:hypothetical protein n=1 Tax=Streptomyces TaxID=1883 RepID=UPI001674777E|nr:hypothetical protein [Streptomyces olivaceoviridis]GGZ13789.1 hypothetical protein GCM10010300_67510 [Streptomyces olivaceoviridis]